MIFKNYLSLISVTDHGDSTYPQQFLILIQLFIWERENDDENSSDDFVRRLSFGVTQFHFVFEINP